MTRIWRWHPLTSYLNFLNHWDSVMHIWVSKIGIFGSDINFAVTIHYVNQCWNIVDWTPRSKLQWNCHRNHTFHSQKSVSKCRLEMAAILFRPQYVKLFVSLKSIWFIITRLIQPVPTQKWWTRCRAYCKMVHGETYVISKCTPFKDRENIWKYIVTKDV